MRQFILAITIFVLSYMRFYQVFFSEKSNVVSKYMVVHKYIWFSKLPSWRIDEFYIQNNSGLAIGVAYLSFNAAENNERTRDVG